MKLLLEAGADKDAKDEVRESFRGKHTPYDRGKKMSNASSFLLSDHSFTYTCSSHMSTNPPAVHTLCSSL